MKNNWTQFLYICTRKFTLTRYRNNKLYFDVPPHGKY